MHLLLALSLYSVVTAEQPSLVLDGFDGPGKEKHIVLVCGDEEYRSEELIPALAHILAKHHGFKCSVVFPIDREDGTINPEQLDNLPGLEALESADLMVLFVRFRDLPEDQAKYIANYLKAGKPIVGLRTSTHAFLIRKNDSYPEWDARSRIPDWEGGFGRRILGETWVAHYGRHQRESTRGLIAEGMEDHPIVRGIDDIWGPSDVYALNSLSGDSRPLIMGQVLTGMQPEDPPRKDRKLVPIAWTKTYQVDQGKVGKVFTTTLGHGGDFQNEGVRRLLVNACYWAMGMGEQIPKKSKVELVGEYKPTRIGVGRHKKGIRPQDYALDR